MEVLTINASNKTTLYEIFMQLHSCITRIFIDRIIKKNEHQLYANAELVIIDISVLVYV